MAPLPKQHGISAHGVDQGPQHDHQNPGNGKGHQYLYKGKAFFPGLWESTRTRGRTGDLEIARGSIVHG
jgi:hypothetical protein